MKVYKCIRQKENLVYSSTGRATYSLEAGRADALDTDSIASVVPGVHTSGEVYNRPDFYLAPREVRLGLSIEF